MEEINEQLVKKEDRLEDILKRVGILIFVGMIGIVLGSYVNGILYMVVVGTAIYGGVHILNITKIEYEYSQVLDELRIDVIYNKSKRKQLGVINLKEVKKFIKVKNDNEIKNMKKIKCFDVEKDENYNLYTCINNEDCVIIMSPNSKMVRGMKNQFKNGIYEEK